jgi:hypothetical protein
MTDPAARALLALVYDDPAGAFRVLRGAELEEGYAARIKSPTR